MHGLIYRTLQLFVQDSHGAESWRAIVDQAELEIPEFEAMLSYDPALAEGLLAAAQQVLSVPRDMLLEDVGTYLVSHPNNEVLRRLLRFGGLDFADFLHSLEDLPDRARLAVPDLVLPDLELHEEAQNQFVLGLSGGFPGFGNVMVGLLRAIADDYGALVLLDHLGSDGDMEQVQIALVDTRHSSGRDFALGDRRIAVAGQSS